MFRAGRSPLRRHFLLFAGDARSLSTLIHVTYVALTWLRQRTSVIDRYEPAIQRALQSLGPPRLYQGVRCVEARSLLPVTTLLLLPMWEQTSTKQPLAWLQPIEENYDMSPVLARCGMIARSG
jgi:hypothetical protein